MSYQDIITIEPGKRGGKPCIRGMRITVYDVLEYLASGMRQDEILKNFPYLTKEDILACLSYAADREKRNLKDLKIIKRRANELNEEALDVLNYQNSCGMENS
jgi:uncharacterized protein (DUF433 family)